MMISPVVLNSVPCLVYDRSSRYYNSGESTDTTRAKSKSVKNSPNELQKLFRYVSTQYDLISEDHPRIYKEKISFSTADEYAEVSAKRNIPCKKSSGSSIGKGFFITMPDEFCLPKEENSDPFLNKVKTAYNPENRFEPGKLVDIVC